MKTEELGLRQIESHGKKVSQIDLEQSNQGGARAVIERRSTSGRDQRPAVGPLPFSAHSAHSPLTHISVLRSLIPLGHFHPLHTLQGALAVTRVVSCGGPP